MNFRARGNSRKRNGYSSDPDANNRIQSPTLGPRFDFYVEINIIINNDTLVRIERSPSSRSDARTPVRIYPRVRATEIVGRDAWREGARFTLNLSISIWLMSSDWGRDLSATRLRRAGGLSVSSGMSSVSWDSELSPPPIIPPLLPPVNAPPDTIYVIRARERGRHCDIIRFPRSRSILSRRRWSECFSNRRGFQSCRGKTYRKIQRIARLASLSPRRDKKSCPFLNAFENWADYSNASFGNCSSVSFAIIRENIESRGVSTHLDLYTAISAVALGVPGSLAALLPLLAAPPNERTEPKHIRLSYGSVKPL